MDELPLKKALPVKEVIICGGLKIGVTHGHMGPSRDAFKNAIFSFKDDKMDVVIFGHSHEPFNENVGETLYFNPGSPNVVYKADSFSYGFVCIDGGKVKAPKSLRFECLRQGFFNYCKMQRLWAPWRDTYITKIIDKHKSCIFCRILAGRKDKRHLVFIREPRAFAVLNLYPYSNGHCLVVPNRHVGDISKLSRAEYMQLMELVKDNQGPFARGP